MCTSGPFCAPNALHLSLAATPFPASLSLQVVHIHSLPQDVSEAEVLELCSTCGPLTALRLGTGQWRGQAVVEFAEPSQARAALTRFAGGADAVRVRGKAIYVTAGTQAQLGDAAGGGGNVGGVSRPASTHSTPSPYASPSQWASSAPPPAPQVVFARVSEIQPEVLPLLHLDLLAAVFQALAPVSRLAAVAQPDGALHCWLQCPDARAAAQLLGARGVRIPASVLGPEAHPPVVEGFFATGLPVLGVMKQSLCARDLEDASLPWGEPDWGFLQALPVPPQALQADSGGAGAAGTVGAPPAGSQTVVCATFDNQVYPVTVEGLHTVSDGGLGGCRGRDA